MRSASHSAPRVVAVISGAAWVWSWYTMYLEVHRWKHLTKSSRFNAGAPIPGTAIRARPGFALKALFVCAAGSPAAIAAMARARAASGQEGSGLSPYRWRRLRMQLRHAHHGFVSGTATS